MTRLTLAGHFGGAVYEVGEHGGLHLGGNEDVGMVGFGNHIMETEWTCVGITVDGE